MALDLFNPRSLALVRHDHWDPWNDWPQRLFDKHFGLDLNEFREALDLSKVDDDEQQFTVRLDCSHFRPEEIEVRVRDRDVLIHAKHEERTDEHGWIRREFTRRYRLPKECEPDKVVTNLDQSGVLVLEAPKKHAIPMTAPNERIVPIEYRAEGKSSYIDGLKNWFKWKPKSKM